MHFKIGRWPMALASALLIAAPGLQAQTADPCAEPGVEIITDAAGDWDGDVGGTVGQGIGLPEQDVVGVSVYQTDGDAGEVLLHFNLRVAGAQLPMLIPNAAWFSSFQSPVGQIYGVRLQTDPTGAASYFSYVAGVSNADTTDGRFVEAGSAIPAVEGSGPDADGNIRIVVRASDVGVFEPGSGDVLIGFNAATIQSVPEGVLAFVVDGAPGDLSRGPELYEPQAHGSCGSTKGGLAEMVGGGFGWAALLPLVLAGFGRRRRARG